MIQVVKFEISEGKILKRLKGIISLLAVCTISFSAMGCKMIEKTPEAIQKTVYATIGDKTITKADFDEELALQGGTPDKLKQQFGEDYENNEQYKKIKQQLLERLADDEVMLQQTEITFSDDEINTEVEKQISTLKEQIKQQSKEDDAYEKWLETNNLTDDLVKKLETKQVKLQKIYQETIKDVSVSDDAVKSYYDENKDSQFTVQGEIDFDKSLKSANEIKAQLDGGADFAELAKEKSQDPGSKNNGGSLGFKEYSATDFVKEFMDAFKTLKEGEVSEPVKSQFGYHIIKATGVKEDGADVSHILIADRGEGTVKSFDEVKEQIKSQLLQQEQSKAFKGKMEEWKNAIKVKTYEDRL